MSLRLLPLLRSSAPLPGPARRGAHRAVLASHRAPQREPTKKTTAWSAVLVAWLVLGCGYEPAYAGSAPEQKLAVVAAPALAGRSEAVQAALGGVRSELSKAGALRPGDGYPRAVVQLVRLDERGSGIARFDAPGGALPLARGSSVGVVGRAWVEESAGAQPARDTGDVRRVRHYASAGDPRIEEQRHAAALRSAARELGRALGRRVLGEPEPENEEL